MLPLDYWNLKKMILKKRTHTQIKPKDGIQGWTYNDWISRGLPDTEENKLIFLQKKDSWVLELLIRLPEFQDTDTEETEPEPDPRYALIIDIQTLISDLNHQGVYPEIFTDTDIYDLNISELTKLRDELQEIEVPQ